MKKFLLSLVAICASAVYGMAADDVVCSFTGTSWNGTSGYSETQKSLDNAWQITNAHNNSAKWDYIRIGAKGSSSKPVQNTAKIQKITEPIAAPISTVKINFTTLKVKSSTIDALKVIVSDDAKFSETEDVVYSAATLPTKTTDTGEWSIDITNPAPNKYYSVEISVTNKTTTAGVAEVDKITFVSAATSEPTLGELIVMADGKKVEDIGEATIELGKSITMTAENATTFEVMCNNPEFIEEIEGPSATWTPAGICENSDVEITPYMNGVPGEKFVFSLTVIAPKQQVDKFEWSTPSVTLMQGDEFTAPTFTCEPAELDIVFSSSNPDVATVGTDGTIELGGAIGVAVITASLTDHDTYSDATAVCTITVTRPGIKVPLHTGIWQRIDNVDQLKDGEIYTIVGHNNSGDYVMKKTPNTNNIPAKDITITNGLFSSDEETALVVLIKEGENFSFFISNTETPGYLFCNTNDTKKENYCGISEEMKGDASLATISIDNTKEKEGQATVNFLTSASESTSKRLTFQFNASSKLFSCYNGSQAYVYIYGVHTPAPEVDDFTPIDDNTHSVSLLAVEGAEIWYRISPVMMGNADENAVRAREAASREYINSGSNSVTQTITTDQQIDYYAVLHGRESQRMAHSKRNGTTGINAPVVNEISLGAGQEWFDLQGRRVSSPSKGNLYILKNGSKVSKRVF